MVYLLPFLSYLHVAGSKSVSVSPPTRSSDPDMIKNTAEEAITSSRGNDVSYSHNHLRIDYIKCKDDIQLMKTSMKSRSTWMLNMPHASQQTTVRICNLKCLIGNCLQQLVGIYWSRRDKWLGCGLCHGRALNTIMQMTSINMEKQRTSGIDLSHCNLLEAEQSLS